MGIDSGPAMGVVAGSTIPSYCIMSTRGLRLFVIVIKIIIMMMMPNHP